MRLDRTLLACASRAAPYGAALWLVACGERDIFLGDSALEADGSAPTLGPFAEPTPIVELLSAEGPDDDPSLSADLTLIFFNAERELGRGKEDVWFSSRQQAGDPWAAPEPATELNTEYRETGIALAPDGLTIWFSSDRPGGAGNLDIYVAQRAARTEAWTTPERVDEISGAGDDLVSAVEPSGRVLYLSRRENESDDYDLFVAQRASLTAAWHAPEPLASLNTEAAESDAFSFQDGMALVFTRDGELMLAERAQASEPFGGVMALQELNSADDDRDAWLSVDGRYAVFSSDRSGEYRLYQASR